MNETGLKVAVDVMGWLFCGTLVTVCVLFFANLKIYTEIMKEKANRDRK